MKTMYAVRNVPYNYDDANEPTDLHIFEADNAADITAELIRIDADDKHYSVEIYRVDDDGDFYDGSDYDTPSNFIKCTRERNSRIL